MTPKYSEAVAMPGKVFFAGTFDPFTVGHKSIVDRALAMFAHVVIGIGYNPEKPGSDASATERACAIGRIYADNPRVTAMAYAGMTCEAAAECGATALLRGVRSVKDFEYERDLADANRNLSGLDTVLIYALPELAWVSSSMVRELKALGRDVTALMAQPS